MVTAAAATAFRVQSRNPNLEMRDILNVMNEEVGRVGRGKFQMTMSAFVLNTKTGEYKYYSAAGLPLLCMPAGGKPRVIPCIGSPLGSREFSLGGVRIDPSTPNWRWDEARQDVTMA